MRIILFESYKKHSRDFGFSSSEKRGNGCPKAPKRISGGKVISSISDPKVQTYSEMRNYTKPPGLVGPVVNAVMVMLG